ncbi:unnamed protein product, partial [Brenthis ino]
MRAVDRFQVARLPTLDLAFDNSEKLLYILLNVTCLKNIPRLDKKNSCHLETVLDEGSGSAVVTWSLGKPSQADSNPGSRTSDIFERHVQSANPHLASVVSG